MSNIDFVHLHVHTEFSLLDGLGKITDYVNKAKDFGMKSLAITDHGVMYGAYKFFEYANKVGLKPIIGVEAYVAPRSRFLKDGSEDKEPNHLILLATNVVGYKNLIKIVSKSFLEGFYYKPRVDKDLLYENRHGLVALSACLIGEVADRFFSGDEKGAEKSAIEYEEIFGRGNFYLEMQDHPEIDDQVKFNSFLISLSEKTGIPLVVTKDCHYVEKEDSIAQDVLVCVQTNKRLNDKNRLSMADTDFSFVSQEEMFERFSFIPEAISNTVLISERCESLELNSKTWYFPNPFKNGADKSFGDILRETVFERGEKKLGRKFNEEELSRVEYELDIIIFKGYDRYTLVVMDFIDWMHEKGIPTTIRGSAAGSFVSYLIGISPVNPLEFGLPFERYLNKERPTLPDIDIDISDEGRKDVIRYVTEKYGEKNVAQIITFGRMYARAAIRDVGRVLGKSYSFVDSVAKMIPELPPAAGRVTIDRAIKISNELKNAIETNQEVKEIIDLARKIEGTARHSSVHAAGVVITPEPIENYVPLAIDQDGNKVTQYEFGELEKIGLVKYDFLGLKNLSTVAHVFDTLRAKYGINLSLSSIPTNDKKTFDLLGRGDTYGVFQLESEGMKRVLRRLKPTKVSDIAAIVALYRPGPMKFIDQFIEHKKNPEKIKYIDDRFKEILKFSYGLIVYQDDVLYIATKVAGYSWQEADKLRKAMGKKIPAEMQKEREKLMNGLISNGLTKDQAEDLWHSIETFAGYGFNKAHAACYGTLAYQTAFLKANYPTEYMAAIMQAEVGNNEKVGEAIKECKRMGISVLPPDINESYKRFTSVDEKTIRFGFLAVKNVGEAVVDGIIRERKRGGKFSSIKDFFERVDHNLMNKKNLESFIKAGVFDSLEKNRKLLLENLESMQEYARNFQEKKRSGQESLFGGHDFSSKVEFSLKDEGILDFSDDEKALFEREILGLYISYHPLSKYSHVMEDPEILSPDSNLPPDECRILIGVFGDVKRKITKNGTYMAFASFEGFFNQIEAVFFPKFYHLTQSIVPGRPYFVFGKITKGLTLDALKSGTEDGETKVNVDAIFGADCNVEYVKKQIREICFKSDLQNSFNGGDGLVERKKKNDVESIYNNKNQKNYLSLGKKVVENFSYFSDDCLERLILRFLKETIDQRFLVTGLQTNVLEDSINLDFSRARMTLEDLELLKSILNEYRFTLS